MKKTISKKNTKTAQPPIAIDYTVNNKKTVKGYELMVVACDPRNLQKVCNYNAAELAIFKQLQNFTFHTTLIKVPLTTQQKHGVIFAPYALDKMAGSVYGFRNESAKRFGLKVSNTMTENLVTVYQLLGPSANPYTPAQFAAILAKELPTLNWWPFGAKYTIIDSVTTPYFDHFSQTNLIAGSPWNLLKLQGKNKTLYVHGFTCFESVLDCWGYENMLLSDSTITKQALPANKAAPIAIIGAGVSGLLFAVKLKRLGYSNIDLLESTDRYGGKTHTIKMNGPYPPGQNLPTYCELGTCYMSPAYTPMIEDLSKYLVGNSQISFGTGDDGFRAIVTKDQLPPNFKAPPVMANSEYVLRKAEAELGLTPGFFDDKEAQLDLLIALGKYVALHLYIFGEQAPMPSSPPEDFLKQHASKTFMEFLRYHKLEAIIGILQYGYEVQGYGPLKNIPAYYGLVWITPPIVEAIIKDAFGYTIPIVTAWSKGWGDLWSQIVTKENLKIILNAKINSIKRLG